MPIKDKEKNREYQREWARQKYANPEHFEARHIRRTNIVKENRIKVKAIKAESCCSECGENHPATLDFHHVDPTTKRYNISDLLANKFGWDIIQTELDKCIILCANCHRKLHWDDDNV